MNQDLSIRTAAFQWISEQVTIHGDVLPRRPLLERGFIHNGERISLVSAQGIFKPKLMSLPLSITTSPEGPYDDAFHEDGYLLYKYRGTDPYHRDNVGLRSLMIDNTPLIYFHGIVKNRYLAVWPVFIVGDNPGSLTFKVAVDDVQTIKPDNSFVGISEDNQNRREYLTTTIRQRLHQRDFREKVLQAYQTSCAFCHLKHRELLDAAHIIPDSEPEGKPIVTNGMALCKLHHAAFDSFLVGVTPDYIIQIRQDLLDETDGPVLQHGLKNLHGTQLILPISASNYPDRDNLAWRYDRFINEG